MKTKRKPGRKPGDLGAAFRGEHTEEYQEFAAAMVKFKKEHRILFPSFLDHLYVAKQLGYKR